MTMRFGAGLVLAAAGCGGLLALHHEAVAARAAGTENISFAPKPAPKSQTFPGTCNVKDGAAADSRPDPAWVSASYDNDHCAAPVLPARLDGQRASRDAIMAYVAAEKRYDAGADAFQRCIEQFVGARNQTISPALAIIENHRILASRAAKEKLSAQVAQAVTAFNAFGSDCPD